MNNINFDKKFLKSLSNYKKVFVIISPPRCASTAIARIFWKFESVKYYLHEPFEETYYNDKSIDYVIEKISTPIIVKKRKLNRQSSIVIKEMPYQVGDNFKLLISATKFPILFLIRDPRLALQSRINKKTESGQSSSFPLVETGWMLLNRQINYVKRYNIPYKILNTDKLRNLPLEYVKKLTNVYHEPFHLSILNWKPRCDIDLDNLNGMHRHLYEKVLSSSGIIGANDIVPDLSKFPLKYRKHILYAIGIFNKLDSDINSIKIT